MGEKKRRGKPVPFDSIESAWNLVAQVEFPPDMPPEVRAMLRRMFFMGAGALFDIQMHNMDPDREPTDADMRRMDRIYEELKEFSRVAQRESAMNRPPGTGH